LPGIDAVTGDLGDSTLVVTYDPAKVSPDEIIQKVNEAGFSVNGTYQP